VMDVIFGEKTGRMRHATSTALLQASLKDAHNAVNLKGDLLHAESLLRHWAKKETESKSALSLLVGTAKPSQLSNLGTEENIAPPTKNVELTNSQIVQLKRAEMSAWFRGAPFESLRRGDIEDFIACTFFSRTPREVHDSGYGKELVQLADEMVSQCEHDMPSGTSDAKAMKATMDPIPWTHRPLFFYAFTHLSVKAITHVAMRYLGFQHYCSGSLGYWYKPGTGKPRVFCHGVGLGVLPYTDLIRRLAQDPRPLFAVEFEVIAMRIQKTVPSPNEIAANIRDMLYSWDFQSAHFIGHSFGTVVIGWVANFHHDIIRRASFVDPVCFLLCNPMMSWVFMYRKPRTGFEKIMHFFVSSELYLANTMFRHFVWHECTLWEEDLHFKDGALIILSGEDQIVPSHEVQLYLQKQSPASTELVFLDGLIHGECLLRPSVVSDIVSRLNQGA